MSLKEEIAREAAAEPAPAVKASAPPAVDDAGGTLATTAPPPEEVTRDQPPRPGRALKLTGLGVTAAGVVMGGRLALDGAAREERERRSLGAGR